jgi:MATE family multidrug resistance protein
MFSKDYIRHYREHIILSLPVAVSQLGHIFVGVADTVIAGIRLGTPPLASAAIASSLFFPILMMGIGISYGATSLIARASGAGDKKEIGIIFKHSLVLNLLLSIVLFFMLYKGAFILNLLDQPAEVAPAAVDFAEWLAWSILPLMVFQTFKQFAEGLSNTRQAMVISISSNILNVLLIFVFIDGFWIIPAMGLNGIAVATFVARIFMAMAMMTVVLTDKQYSEYLKDWKIIRFKKSKFSELIKISLPIGLQLTLEAAAFGFAFILVGRLGTKEIAAHQIALNMAGVTYMGATGISAAATVRVGNEFGRKDFVELRKAGYSALMLVVGYMSITAISFVCLRYYLPTLYIEDITVIQIASTLLLIAAFFQLSDGIQVVGLGALRGMGDVVIPTVAALVAYWVIGLPLGYWLAFKMGLGIEGIWYGLSLGLILVSVFLFLRFRMKSRKLVKG